MSDQAGTNDQVKASRASNAVLIVVGIVVALSSLVVAATVLFGNLTEGVRAGNRFLGAIPATKNVRVEIQSWKAILVHTNGGQEKLCMDGSIAYSGGRLVENVLRAEIDTQTVSLVVDREHGDLRDKGDVVLVSDGAFTRSGGTWCQTAAWNKTGSVTTAVYIRATGVVTVPNY